MSTDRYIHPQRIGNASNRYQGNFKKVLCVCSGGLLRSPTIAWVLSQPPYEFNTRAAGTSEEYALVLVEDPLLVWADEIVCADDEHRVQLVKRFDITRVGPVHVLHIPDYFPYRDETLVQMVQERVAEVWPKTARGK